MGTRMSLLHNPKTEQDGQDVRDVRDGRGLKVEIVNDDFGLRRRGVVVRTHLCERIAIDRKTEKQKKEKRN